MTRWRNSHRLSFSSLLSSDLCSSTLVFAEVPHSPLTFARLLKAIITFLYCKPSSMNQSQTTASDFKDFSLTLHRFDSPSRSKARPDWWALWDKPKWTRTMLEKMSRRSRSLLSLSLTSLALSLSVLAFCTSYWCEGTHKVVKPVCLSPVKMKNCGQNNSQPYTTGEACPGL